MDCPAFAFVPPAAPSPLLFVCDHASRALPPAYGTLGLDEQLLATHIGWDIGAGAVTRTLAAAYGAAAVLGRWSRLLIDLNRGPDDPTLVMRLSDGSPVPGNAHVDAEEIAHRLAMFHAPYHAAIAGQTARLGAKAVLVSVHSFTPVWKTVPRPWEVGVLYDRDTRLAAPLMEELAKAGFMVGDNEPYHGALDGDTLNRHGTAKGLPHVLVEIRQDLVGTDDAARGFAAWLKPILDKALARL
jgi:predicted N-formylglutamate amidohydrolase